MLRIFPFWHCWFCNKTSKEILLKILQFNINFWKPKRDVFIFRDCICILSILYCISMKFLQFTEASRRDCWGSPLYPTSIAYCTEFQWIGAALRERKIYHNLGYCLSMLFLRKDNGWFITQTKPIYYCWTTFWLKAFLGETLIMSSVLTHIKHCSQKCNLNQNI